MLIQTHTAGGETKADVSFSRANMVLQMSAVTSQQQLLPHQQEQKI